MRMLENLLQERQANPREKQNSLNPTREEHEAILARRENSDSGFTWKEYKSMKFTFQNPTVGFSSENPIHLSGIFIPLLIRNDDMQEMELTGASKHFTAFGGGMRFCLGTDFAKVQMAVFLHCLVTKYR
ncbi:hypothetical protein C3L33_17192, partial [Rhododendron williamsianum]